MTNSNKIFKSLAVGIPAILSTCAIWAQLELSYREPLLLLVLMALIPLYRQAFDCRDKKVMLAAAVCAVVFAFFTVMGYLDALIDRRAWRLWTLIRFIGFSFLYYDFMVLLFARGKKLSFLIGEKETRNMSLKVRLRVFSLCWLPIFLCFFVWWLYEFPGNTSPDSNNQIMQATGLLPLSSNHPAVSTLVLGLFYKLGLGLFSGNQNAALALYTIFQLTFMSAVFAFLCETIYEARMKSWVIVAVVIIYLVVPHHGSYSVTVWKDVLFAGWGTALCISTWRLMLHADGSKACKNFDLFMLYLSALGASLYRNGIYYAFFLLFPFFFVVFRNKSRAAWLMPLIVPVIAIIINGPVFSSFNISHNDFIESHSLPAQHIARVIKDGHPLTDEQYKLLSKVVDVDAVAETYNAGIADPIKTLVRETGNMDYLTSHKKEFGRLWLELGMKYPGAYLRAQIDQTRGYWYPDVDYWSMSNHCWESDSLGIVKDRQLPTWACKYFDTVYFYLDKMPLAGLIYSIGLATWTLIALFALCIVKGLKKELLLYVPILAVVLAVCIVTPVFAEYRYVYCMFTALPLLAVLPFSHVNNHKANAAVPQ